MFVAASTPWFIIHLILIVSNSKHTLWLHHLQWWFYQPEFLRTILTFNPDTVSLSMIVKWFLIYSTKVKNTRFYCSPFYLHKSIFSESIQICFNCQLISKILLIFQLWLDKFFLLSRINPNGGEGLIVTPLFQMAIST